MKFKIKPNSIDTQTLEKALSTHFDGQYKVSTRNKFSIVVAKNDIIGTIVIVQKDKINVVGNFATLKVQFIFMMLIVLLALIIPLIIYFLVFHKKMKAIETEVVDFIKTSYKDYIIE
jgi:uncharacterized membrane protein YukC